MPYTSTITFTLDTICSWTYLAYLRLTHALSQFSSTSSNAEKVTFTLRLAPYQLYPDFTAQGEDKYTWYKREKYNDDESVMQRFVAYMSALGSAEGISFDFHGLIANTLPAHRILYSLQTSQSQNLGPEAARKALESFYSQYFTQRAHPSSKETLLAACKAAGLDEAEAKELVDDESEGLGEVKAAIREQAGNGVDSVPWVVFEGRRRDFTFVGAKRVEEYVKVLEQVAKEV